MKIPRLFMVLSFILISIISCYPSLEVERLIIPEKLIPIKLEPVVPYATTIFINQATYDEKLEKSKEVYIIAYTLRELEGGHKYFKNGKPLPGASGEQGVYQFMPSTWRMLCKRYFRKVLDKTKENQDMVAYRYIEYLLDKKYTTEQIASVWNSGKPNSNAEGINKYGVAYSVPKYKAKFLAIYNRVKKEINLGNLEPKLFANGNNGLYIYILMQNNNNIKTTMAAQTKHPIIKVNLSNKWNLTIMKSEEHDNDNYEVHEDMEYSLFKNPLSSGSTPGQALDNFFAVEEQLLASL